MNTIKDLRPPPQKPPEERCGWIVKRYKESGEQVFGSSAQFQEPCGLVARYEINGTRLCTVHAGSVALRLLLTRGGDDDADT